VPSSFMLLNLGWKEPNGMSSVSSYIRLQRSTESPDDLLLLVAVVYTTLEARTQ